MARRKEITAPGRALIKVRIHGREYDAVRDNRCQTCMHPARLEIEEKILQGVPYPQLARLYSGVEWTNADGTTITLPRVDWQSIRNHYKAEHLPIEAAVLREIADQRAQELGQRYEEQTTTLVDGYSYAKQVLAITAQSLATGKLQPDVKDGLAAAKLIQEMESSAQGNVDSEAWSEAMTIFFETAQKFMPPDAWQQFGTALATNPILAAIQQRLAGQSDDVLDAEVVDR